LDEQGYRSALGALKQAGWAVTEKDPASLDLDGAIRSRYPSIPDEYLTFLSCFSICANPADTAWFLSEDDFNGTTESAFAWNEFEKQSFEAADGDAALERSISAFWDAHLPILLSVKSGYAYVALVVAGANRGAVVTGREPEYEESDDLFDSFDEFLDHVTSGAGYRPSLDEML